LPPDALRQRYELHMPLHPYTQRTRGELVATLQQLCNQHYFSDIDTLCQTLERFLLDASVEPSGQRCSSSWCVVRNMGLKVFDTCSLIPNSLQ
jgi:hypothetical protein